MNKRKLRVSEFFYSIQGEGATSGVPAVFLRLGGCNLLCGRQPNDQPTGFATWECDTIDVWRKSKPYSAHELVAHFLEYGYSVSLRRKAHLVLTGGEPLLQQDVIPEFLDALYEVVPDGIYIEVETNGTVLPSGEMLKRVSQWNISPKLKNSGQADSLRYRPDVLKSFSGQRYVPYPFGLVSVFYKFVITRAEDWKEILSDFIDPGIVSPSQIILMPGAASREALAEIRGFVVDLCKEHGVRYSSRLQLDIWDKATGV